SLRSPVPGASPPATVRAPLRGAGAEATADRIWRFATEMSYQVSDNAEPHRSSTEVGATLFIVD
ncbi:MAG: hypothetical protein FJW35_01675, partial [Acidobacteria bacterium]|nr:hypothetical protein [Acidobacteriota bacterium]